MICHMKRYSVSVLGFSPVDYDAVSPGKARAAAWRDYACGYPCEFKDFLKISSIKLCQNLPLGYGRKIKVSGKRAFFLQRIGTTVKIVFPGDDFVLHSHELDVKGLDKIEGVSDAMVKRHNFSIVTPNK